MIVSVGNKTTDAVLSAITSPLVALTVRGCSVTEQGLKNVAKHCHCTLRSLDASFCRSIYFTIEERKVYFPELKHYRAAVW